MYTSTDNLLTTTIYPHHSAGATVRAFTRVRPPRFSLHAARYHRLLCPLLTPVARWAYLTIRSVLKRTRNGSPGVNTYLSTRKRRVYAPGPIMDRGLNPVLRTRPSQIRLTRFLYVAPCVCDSPPRRTRFLQKPCYQDPVAVSLSPSPPSGWVRDLPTALLSRAAAHLIEYVPSPAHNKSFHMDSANSRATSASGASATIVRRKTS